MPAFHHRGLFIARVLLLGPVALAFPVACAAVFVFGVNRNAMADGLAVVYSVGLCAGISTSLWPLPGLRGWSRQQRIESLCRLFVMISCMTHLTWELGWLLLHRVLPAARESAWAFPWWAYIDGGDLRYLEAPPSLLAMETLSVCNGLIGAAGLWLWSRSRGRDPRGTLLCMAMAVVHLYSTSVYFLSEIYAGLPNVDTRSIIDTYFKFGLANAPWLIYPVFVLHLGWRRLSATATVAAPAFEKRRRVLHGNLISAMRVSASSTDSAKRANSR